MQERQWCATIHGEDSSSEGHQGGATASGDSRWTDGTSGAPERRWHAAGEGDVGIESPQGSDSKVGGDEPPAWYGNHRIGDGEGEVRNGTGDRHKNLKCVDERSGGGRDRDITGRSG